MWLCVSFFAEGKIKDIVYSAEDVLNEFPVLSLVIAITQKTKFCCKCQQFLGFLFCQNTGSHNRMHFGGNKQPGKNWAECTQESRGWRRPGGSSAAELCQVVRSVRVCRLSCSACTLLHSSSGVSQAFFAYYFSFMCQDGEDCELCVMTR